MANYSLFLVTFFFASAMDFGSMEGGYGDRQGNTEERFRCHDIYLERAFGSTILNYSPVLTSA